VEILIVFGSQYGNTQRVARAIGAALEDAHRVRILPAAAAADIRGEDVDLVFVGAPTQMRGSRLLAKPFLDGLAERGFGGTPTAAFDTRMELGPQLRASVAIAKELVSAGCRSVTKPQSYVVLGLEGPLADGEEARAAAWARAVVRSVAADAALPERDTPGEPDVPKPTTTPPRR
jgi:flavodoxin